MKTFDIKSLTESGLLSALTVIGALISVYVPVLDIAATFIWTLPIVILVVRHGLRWGLLSALVSGIIMSILIEPMTALRMIIGFAPPSLVIGYGFQQNWPASRTLLMGLTMAVGSIMCALMLLFAVTSINPLEFQINVMKESFDSSMAFYSSMGMEDAAMADTKKNFEMAFELITMLMPLIVVFSSLLTCWASFALGSKVLRRLGHPVNSLPPFNCWRLPKAFVYIFGFSLVGLYWGNTRDIDILNQLSVNFCIFSIMGGFLQGSSLLSAIADRFHLSRIIFWLVLLFVFLNGIAAQVLSFIGLFDMIFDYRKRLGMD